jgi:serine/threonine-protein kinase
MSGAPVDDDDLKQTTVSPSRRQEPSQPEAPSGRATGVRPGEVLAGKYQVGSVLGQGGVGVVVSATHLLLQQKVAIKVLLDETDPEQLARFLREGQSAARLKGPHVARVIDMGQLPSGAPFMVMEFLEGRDLAAKLEQEGPLAVEDAVELIVQACEAMAEAHTAGIVHRDLKPANLFLTRAPDGAPCLKVVDFGISRDLGDPMGGNGRLTRTTSVFGSPLYMPPEQMRSTRLTDARSDIWALGVILYELLTGRTPFDAELYPDLVLKVATEAPPPPSSVRHLPPALEAAILRCLEKRQEHRFQDVGQLAAALAPFAPPRAQGNLERIQRFMGGAPAAAPLVTAGAAAGAVSATAATAVLTPVAASGAPAASGPSEPAWAQTATEAARAPRAPQRSLGRVLAAAGLGALLMGVGAVAVLKGSGGADAEPTPAVGAEPKPGGEGPQAAQAAQAAQGTQGPAGSSAVPQVVPGGSAPAPGEAAAVEPPPEGPAPRSSAAASATSATPKKPAAGKAGGTPVASPPPQAPTKKNQLDLPEM